MANEFRSFAAGAGANALAPSAWAALATLLAQGFQPGVASSEQINTVLRQTSVGVTGVAQFAQGQGQDMLDDGNVAAFAAKLLAAITNVATQAAQTVAGQQFVQPGHVAFYARETPPLGWLRADGSVVLRAAFPNLFAAIGTRWGSSSLTTFVLPDLQGAFIRGWQPNGPPSIDGGRQFGSTQASMLQAHRHLIPWGENGSGPWGNTPTNGYTGSNATDNDNFWWLSNSGYDELGTTVNPAGLVGSETRPHNVALLACIKA